MAIPTETRPQRPPLLQRVTSRQWALIDVGLCGLFFLGGLAIITVDRGHKGLPHHFAWLLVTLCLASGPIALRRLYPMPVLLIVTAALAASTMLGQGFIGVPMVALPLYSVVVRFDRRTSLLALSSVELLLLASLGVAALQGPIGAGASFSVVVAGATWIVGDSVRARRAHGARQTIQAEERRREEVARAENSVIEERLQIARELHDIIAHSLGVIAVQSGVGGHVLDTQPEEARKSLAAIEATSRSALEEVRGLLGVLRRGDLDEPSRTPALRIADLDRLFDELRATGFGVAYQVHGQVVEVPPSIDLTVYRIVQEALTNVRKHSHATSATVDITFDRHGLVVSVIDDGGVDPSRDDVSPIHGGDARGGHGIIGMRERVRVFGGSLAAAPIDGGGFEVRALLPMGGVLP
ncbi:MAG: sensor histidine kinase [Acidimicrobiales bacterium]|jgi:signal transduction histidine kinase